MSLFQNRPFTTLPLRLRTNQKPLLLAAGLTLAATPLLTYAWSCYTEWLSLGRGGVPYNMFGWFAQTLLHPFARRDTRSPVPTSFASASDVAALYGPAATKSYLAAWARGRGRPGDRPAVPTFVAPQRQTTEGAREEVVGKQKAFLGALAKANPGLFEVRDSGLEGPLHQALFLRSFSPSSSSSSEKEMEVRTRLGRGSRGEFAHVHGEGSTHVTLSTADATALVESRWAERHKLSGVGGRRAMLPFGYVLLYAPRGRDEFEFWQEVVLAGARYAAEGAGGEVVVPK
ncbi:hypothetical protein F4821DRAFT_52411 [Hypoxylon rubiginosum]|uniref:Uncharacterized protein n=1 Tax=Hypoxylon rubiginosum TaxID=110542 RepID=A0ACC0DB63_9PEZI|nr:hypothetical protein F4821DRAFT_52411 [Hypoxylon rubiginosum]